MLKKIRSTNIFNNQVTWLVAALAPLYYSAYMEREKKFEINAEIFDTATEEEIVSDYFQPTSADARSSNEKTTGECAELFPLSKDYLEEANESLTPNAIAQQVQQEISNFLKEQGEKSNSQECLEKLACSAYVLLFFERTYQRILGSHIKLLEYLEFHLGRSISEEDVYKIFLKNAPVSQRKPAFFAKWLKFLERSYFIQIHEGTMTLTNSGLEFLKYTRKRGYSLSRPG